MRRIIVSVAVGMLAGVGCLAQNGDKYVITGEMTRDSLRFTPQAVRMVYLACQSDGKEVRLDSAVVKNKTFRFEGKAPRFVEAAYLSGFDNGSVQLLLEPGNITVQPFDAHYPVSAKVSGTPCNDVMSGYYAVRGKDVQDSKVRMNNLFNSLPEEVKNNPDLQMDYHGSVFNVNTVMQKVVALEYLRNHLDSEAALFIIKYDIYHLFQPKTIERTLMRAVSPRLRQHPVYRELENKIKASNLKVGSPAPDIAGVTPEGKEISLSDYKGKYVLLDIWASWCGPCRREFPYLKQAMTASEANDQFVILSYSIDSKEPDWVNSIEKNELKHKNWIHFSTLKGWSSDAVSLFNVQGVPHTVLLNPKGEVVAFNLRGEEMLNKVKRIIEGVETYE